MAVRTIQRTPSAYRYPLLIKDLLQPPMLYAADQEIVYRDLKRYDYSTLGRRVAQLAHALNKLGVKEGDTVAVMDWDSHRYLECYFAIPMIGAILHTVNIRLSSEQLLYTINHAEDDVILVNSDFLPMLEGVKDKLETVKKIVLLQDSGDRPQTSLDLAGEYEELIGAEPTEYDFPDFDEDAVATTFYTTGTTGLPKGVYFSHRQLVLHTHGLMHAICARRSVISIDSGDVYMPLTPMFHVHAWGVPYFSTYLGTKQVYPGRYEPEVLLKLLLQEQVTFSHCVPTILHMLLSSPAVEKVDLSGWKLIIGGSALPKGLCREALKRGINLTTGYGMSETCPILTIADLKPHMQDWDLESQVDVRCRTGLPIPHVQLRIADPMNNPLPHDGASTGELVVRTPWLTQGYLKDPDKSEELWTDGWLHTGDVGYIDQEGYLKLTDRLKDVIKTGGEWISSLALEDIISQHEAVSEVAVVGVPDEKWGERPLALVVIKPDSKGTVSEQDLKDFVMGFVQDGTIPKYGLPDRIEQVEEIPKTSVGKLNKKEIRKMYQ
jgi:fatty-acyl-CoA synthase